MMHLGFRSQQPILQAVFPATETKQKRICREGLNRVLQLSAIFVLRGYTFAGALLVVGT